MDDIRLHHDYETASEIDLSNAGLDAYSSDSSTRILMVSYDIVVNDKLETSGFWDLSMGGSLPIEFREAMKDRGIAKVAFNAEFERTITTRVAKIKTPYDVWRCTMAKAAMHSFTGSLGDIAVQMGMPADKIKDPEGTRLIRMFCMPQKVTKKQPHRWRNWETDPEDWLKFCAYCRQDTVSERDMWDRLAPYPIWDTAWQEYALDQKINDRGIPVDVQLCENAKELAARRKKDLIKVMKEETGLANPNSVTQLLPWIKQRGYPYDDMEKASIMKVIEDHEELCKKHGWDPADDDNDTETYGTNVGITAACYRVLKMRRQTSRTSVSKYGSFTKKIGPGDRFRFNTKFGGAARTFRYSGRGVQIQNLHRTPSYLEPDGDNDYWLVTATEAIREGDYDLVQLLCDEPMDLIAGCIRSAIRAPEGLVVHSCDLASIESVVIGWLARCERLLNVFRDGKDAYKDFATELFKVEYSEVTKTQRKLAKPATLGAGYRLGGGSEINRKKTGLWGYAEGMGVKMTRKQAHESVQVFRETYHEIVTLWYELEKAIARTLRTGEVTSVGPVQFELRNKDGRCGPGKHKFLCAILPSGRRLYYYKPRLEKKKFISYDQETGKPKIDPKTGEKETYTRIVFSYMGKHPDKPTLWVRIDSHGGKMTENLVQAIARDILQLGLIEADERGYNIIFHVHDEINAMHDPDDEEHNAAGLRDCMIQIPHWAPDIPLNASAATWQFYRKD